VSEKGNLIADWHDLGISQMTDLDFLRELTFAEFVP